MNVATITRLLSLLAIVPLLGGVAGCNTLEGAGEDIEAAGEAVEESADDDEE